MPQSYLSSSQRVPECAGDTYSATYVSVLPVWEVFVLRLGKFDLPSSQQFELKTQKAVDAYCWKSMGEDIELHT